MRALNSGFPFRFFVFLFVCYAPDMKLHDLHDPCGQKGKKDHVTLERETKNATNLGVGSQNNDYFKIAHKKEDIIINLCFLLFDE